MAVFGGDNWREEWRIEQMFEPVVLFDELQVLEDALAYLREHSYIVHEFDCRGLQSSEAILNDVLHQMGVLEPSFTYSNIQDIQFWDLLRDAKVPEQSGLVLAFKHFSGFHQAHPQRAQGMLNAIASEHLWQIKRGRRFWALAHCENRELKLEPVLTLHARWNRLPWSAESITHGERVEPYQQAFKEACVVLRARWPGVRGREFEKALLEAAGAQDGGALIDMEMSTEDMVRLLHEHDFAQAAARGQQQDRFMQAAQAAQAQLAMQHPVLAGRGLYGNSRAGLHKVLTALRQVTKATDSKDVDELELSAEDIVRLLQDYDFDARH